MFKIKIILLANPIWVNLSWTVFLVAVSNFQVSFLPIFQSSPPPTTQCPLLYQLPLHSHYSRKGSVFLWQLLIPPVLYKVPLVIAYFSPKTKGYVIKRVYCIYKNDFFNNLIFKKILENNCFNNLISFVYKTIFLTT